MSSRIPPQCLGVYMKSSQSNDEFSGESPTRRGAAVAARRQCAHTADAMRPQRGSPQARPIVPSVRWLCRIQPVLCLEGPSVDPGSAVTCLPVRPRSAANTRRDRQATALTPASPASAVMLVGQCHHAVRSAHSENGLAPGLVQPFPVNPSPGVAWRGGAASAWNPASAIAVPCRHRTAPDRAGQG
jgi:hypothetical protein